MNIKKILVVISAAIVMALSMTATAVYAADGDAVPEGVQENIFADADSIKGAKTWDNSLSAAAGFAMMGAAALVTVVAASKLRSKENASEVNSDNE